MSGINFNNFIQVAGVIDKNEADMLINCGVNFLGFPLRLPVNKEDLSEEEAKNIIASISNPNFCIVISYSSTANEAIELCQKMGCEIIQLHGFIEKKELIKLKQIAPDITVIKSLVITNNNEKELENTMLELEPFVDAFITDTFDPTTGASGATGKTHDWKISKQLIALSSKPVILAGGLTPSNVYEAIKYVKPAGVDVHTGVEDVSGKKDEKKVIQFLKQAKLAFSEL